MKKIAIRVLILNLLLIVSLSVYAQTEPRIYPPEYRNISNKVVVDSANIRIWYTLNAEKIFANEANKCDDIQLLEIGSTISKYYSHIVYQIDSTATDWREKNPKAKNEPTMISNDGSIRPYWSDCFIDYSKNIFTEYACMPLAVRPNYIVEEDIPTQEWEIHNDTLTVFGYLCQKANCRFRGRDYIAWFTMDIPIQQGPWKFGGLPGLILKIYDVETKFVFECINIENHNKKYPIFKYYDYRNYEKADRNKLLKLQNNIYNNYLKTAGFTPGNPNMDMNKFAKRTYKSPYNTFLLELE